MTLGLAACGQLVSVPASAPMSPLCESAFRAEATSLRILVTFHQPTVGDAPAVLARLQTEADACVRFVSSASPSLHAYVIDTTTDKVKVVASLLRWPAVKAVDTDALVRRH